MSTRRYCVVLVSLVLFATTNPTVEGQSLSWTPIAAGVNYAIPDSSSGDGVFIGIGGMVVEQAWADNWVRELYTARLRSLDIGHLYSVKGPVDIAYQGREIGTLELARHLTLLTQSYPESNPIIVAGHSSGAFVAHALFQELYDGASVDSTHSTDDKILYFVLDEPIGNVPTGVELTNVSAERLAHICGVYSFFQSRNLYSLARNDMIALGDGYGFRSSSWEIDASESGCYASRCMHMTMINRKPYNSSDYDSRDYSAINPDHPVQTAYLDSVDAWVTATVSDPLLPTAFALSQNYPNPFNPSTTISYALPQAAEVTLTVVDVLGRQIRELASGAKPPGTYEVSFDATGLPSGVYFYRLQAGDYVETKRMVVVR